MTTASDIINFLSFKNISTPVENTFNKVSINSIGFTASGMRIKKLINNKTTLLNKIVISVSTFVVGEFFSPLLFLLPL